MIVWGGFSCAFENCNTGARYDPSTNSWTATTTTNAPSGRALHTAVWTGNEMIVWGGFSLAQHDLNTGGRYNPISDSWTATNIASTPSARESHTAGWTGSEMIIWGGTDAFGDHFLVSGGRYDRQTNSWTATGTHNAPAGRA